MLLNVGVNNIEQRNKTEVAERKYLRCVDGYTLLDTKKQGYLGGIKSLQSQ